MADSEIEGAIDLVVGDTVVEKEVEVRVEAMVAVDLAVEMEEVEMVVVDSEMVVVDSETVVVDSETVGVMVADSEGVDLGWVVVVMAVVDLEVEMAEEDLGVAWEVEDLVVEVVKVAK